MEKQTPKTGQAEKLDAGDAVDLSDRPDNPESVSDWLDLGKQLKAQGDPDGAINAFQSALEIDPDAVPARIGLAKSLEGAGNLGASLAELLKLRSTNGRKVFVEKQIARVLGGLKRHEEALQVYDWCLGDAQDDFWALLGRADVLEKMERPDDALETLNRAVDLLPDNRFGLRRLATLRSRLGQYDDAMDLVLRVRAVEPSTFAGRLFEAECLVEMSRFEAARDLCESLADSAEGWVPGTRKLLEIMAGLGMGQAVLRLLDRCPDTVLVRNIRAEALFAGYKLDEAFEVWEQVFREVPDNPRALQQWSRCQLECHDVQPIIDRFQDLMAKGGRETLRFQFAQALVGALHWDMAQQVLGEVSESIEATARAQIRIAHIDLRRGRPVSNGDGLVKALTKGSGLLPVRDALERGCVAEPDFHKYVQEVLPDDVLEDFGVRNYPVEVETWEPPLASRAADRVPDTRDIDVIYTWVDSTDPAWFEAFARVSGMSDDMRLEEEVNFRQRYKSYGEIQFSLQMLERNFPQVRKVFIVTDGQRFDLPDLSPEFACKVRFVDHKEIIPSDIVALPTFNSNVIEAFLHRIEGLSDVSIYLNDDLFFGAPVTEEDLFSDEGVPYQWLVPKRHDLLSEFRGCELGRNWPDTYLLAASTGTTTKLYREVLGKPLPPFNSAHQCMIIDRQVHLDVHARFGNVLKDVLFGAQLRSSTAPRFFLLCVWFGLDTGSYVPFPQHRLRKEAVVVHHDLGPDVVDDLIATPRRFACINVSEARSGEHKRLQEALLSRPA